MTSGRRRLTPRSSQRYFSRPVYVAPSVLIKPEAPASDSFRAGANRGERQAGNRGRDNVIRQGDEESNQPSSPYPLPPRGVCLFASLWATPRVQLTTFPAEKTQ